MPQNDPSPEQGTQGELFGVVLEPSGLPEPGEQNLTARVTEVYPEGHFPEPEEAEGVITPESHAAEVAHAAEVTRNRREGNRGKHSPLERDGSWLQIRPGDFLPDFGPVKDRNWENAKAFAARLEKKRLEALAAQPDLLSPRREEVAEAVGSLVGVMAARDEAAFAEPERTVAGTKTKLEALRDDERAGFLPKTNNEKNQAFELLDYMNLDQYPGGVSTRLREIADHTKSELRKQGVPMGQWTDAVRAATRSVLNEWGDYMDNASVQHQQLQMLQAALSQDVNPRLTVATVIEDLAEAAPDYNGLVRYVDVYEKRHVGSDDVSGMTTRQNRTTTHLGKNKVIEDDYTGQEVSAAMQDHINEAIENMTVREAKIWLKGAIADEARRRDFWHGALQSVRGEFRSAAEQVLENSPHTTS